MEAERHIFRTERTSQYYVLGDPGPQITDLWFVLHGYGQLAQYFIKHFEVIQNDHTLVVAPEALSRFYLDSSGRRVGASWMTREARLDEIRDQVVYLDGLRAHFDALLSPTLRVHLLGFSQGSATAWRWMREGNSRFDSLVVWAGRPPEEYDPGFEEALRSIPVYSVCGTKDPYLKPDSLDVELARIRAKIPHLEFKSFEGEHVMDKGTLVEIAGELDSQKKNFPKNP